LEWLFPADTSMAMTALAIVLLLSAALDVLVVAFAIAPRACAREAGVLSRVTVGIGLLASTLLWLPLVWAIVAAVVLYVVARRLSPLAGTRLVRGTLAGGMALGVAIPLVRSIVEPAYGQQFTALSRAFLYQDGGFFHWLLVVVCLVQFFLVVGCLLSTLQAGPRNALGVVGRVVWDGGRDVFFMSPRRVWALAWLAIKESIRSWVVIVALALFVVLLLFAGLFLDPGSPEPARLYLTFLLYSANFLVVLFALFVSVFSLPGDIQSRRLHTVVTKPVRASEIVLGRMVGFAVVGTLLLAGMGLLSYGFAVLGLRHTHTVLAEDLRPVGQPQTLPDGSQGQARTGVTSRVYRHRHRVYIDPSGHGTVETEAGHWHSLTTVGSGKDVRYIVGGQQGALVARVPLYGKLMFRDRDGFDVAKGINVGDEWTYRSYIQGGTPAAAVWTFSGLTRDRFPDKKISVEMNLGVFRTYKGNIERGVLGSLSLRNPKTGLTVEVEVFESKEFVPLRLEVPLEITKFSSCQLVVRKSKAEGGSVQFSPADDQIDPRVLRQQRFDVFDDLVSDGQLEVWLRCLEPAQYFGAAQPDLYIRGRDASFAWNFVKGCLGIWVQMVLVVGFGVMFSTFLSGPVAMIATAGSVVGGFSSEFMAKLARGETLGGGPIESAIRMVQQDNMISELPGGMGTDVTRMSDSVARFFLRIISSFLPPFDHLGYADYVAYGYNISPSLLAVHLVMLLGFLLPLVIVGYFFLKTREVAA